MNAAGINVNKSGNVSARCARGPLHGFVVTPTARAVPDAGTRRHRVRQRRRRRLGHAGAIVGVALSPRHLRRAAGVRRHRAYALGARDRARLPWSRPAGVPLHGRERGRARSAARPMPRSARRRCRTTRCAALEERRACLLAHHGVIACGSSLDEALGARDRGRASGAHVSRRLHARRAAAAGRGRDDPGTASLRDSYGAPPGPRSR